MPRPKKAAPPFDRDLQDLPEAFRWQAWLDRAEVLLFASPHPVSRETLARVVGETCVLAGLIADLRERLRTRPVEIVAAAGGWQMRSRQPFASTLQAAGLLSPAPDLSRHEAEVLMAIAYFQPVTRRDLAAIFGREIFRHTIAALRAQNLITAGPRSPAPGAPATSVTTRQFLIRYGFDTLRDLPNFEQLEDAGFFGADAFLEGERDIFALPDGEGEDEEDRREDEGEEDPESGRFL